jgi:hypothetical protein
MVSSAESQWMPPAMCSNPPKPCRPTVMTTIEMPSSNCGNPSVYRTMTEGRTGHHRHQ